MSMAVATTCLRAGPLSVRLDIGDLRYIKLGDREVIRRIYAAVRDRNWCTVPSQISNLKSEILDTSFRISYTSTHRQNEVHFVWEAEIAGASDGSILFTFDGEAKSTFLRNRIGFCVLHPIRECAGAKCRARYTDGREKELIFPDIIAGEQPVAELRDLAGLAHEIEPGVWAELKFAGDVFEMEDQRNWIDASFKTYCTPLRMPFPAEVKAGTMIRQSVLLRLHATDGSPVPRRIDSDSAERIEVRHRAIAGNRLPVMGLGVASHGRALEEREVKRLSRIGLSHLRLDLRLADPHWPASLRTAARDAAALGAGIELAIHLPRQERGDLIFVAKELARVGGELTRAVVFRDGQKSTSPADFEMIRAALRDRGIPIGAGTNADLYQLNTQRPPSDADFICWSMNPQVHAFDEASIVETPEAAAQQIASVRRYFPGKPLVVSPITLKPRFNAVSTGAEPAEPPGELPAAVDPRQPTLFAAAWTLAMIKALAESGTDSMTFYETTGWRGVMETELGSTLPAKFPTIPGSVFPIYHVLADVGEFAGGEVLSTESGDPSNVASLCLRAGPRRRLMLANLGAEPRRASFKSSDGIVLLRIVNASTSLTAMTSPEEFRARSSPFHGTELELAPHAIATLDFADH